MTEIDDLIDQLHGFQQAYPEEIFRPLTDEERKQMGTLLDRASAGMGRHLAQYMGKAADAIEQLQRELEEARKDKERLDSGTIMMHERDEFGDSYMVEHRGLDLRKAIDAARQQTG